MNITTAKQCTSRDAATATLRKLGVAKQDYDDYICKKGGIFYTDVIGAEKAIKDEKPVSSSEIRETDRNAVNAVVAEAIDKAKTQAVDQVFEKITAQRKHEAVDHSASNKGIAKVLAADKKPAFTGEQAKAKRAIKATKKADAKKARITKATKADGPLPVAAQKGQKETVAEATRRMLLAGKSNIECWEELLKLFPTIDEKKKQFPAWYRYDMKKKGQLA